MTSRKQCINVPNASYSGKEKSPLSLGLSAEGYELNTNMEGNDNLMWVVKIKNNKKVWVRQNTYNLLVHEDHIIEENHVTIEEKKQIIHKPEIMKQNVEEKKTTDYNLFLTYRLNELKQLKTSKTNKDIFNDVVLEWKELKKNPSELSKKIKDIIDKKL